ncbi:MULTISPECIES: argininosuccinate synthase [Shewanella]|mgnify:FL=1|jgi:argininosuccinate synthase|uniref:Argininosuccinate synthase n=3 Tax=Gammaproteobacteria TaxID=1236 RepID=ASSY_SHEFN|nr:MULTISPECIES: argininosuccinate synthase [Shewanella]Q089K8.1 RecName: Full=Argininosuccinate synthase; AltName: Full=Citrulline--aspartate ligase [Shewanella frigidimarina NCIMB 400]MBB1380816.1 argininosuccinate synthase [Shewanella sp. SR41-2]ABI70057.1 argininosuccinate synthase [Shewanella frigidimarina NCIMB 400]KVX02070.1 argininosuccinate synthase [Shewanella frigidimarina]MBB1426242.1 argininosuccinate synthase [Shewanella sp. SG44-2]RPA23572.1 argininosuccinate synthase [Shewanel|tara:strand:- start:2921 stop:4144 length:1224 start_codon:yes stop_codon:yes gene_type:complete
MSNAVKKTGVKKVVLAYSGGLDTSAIIPWLKETYDDCEIIAFCADVGQGEEELVGLTEKALASGASECHIVDLKEEFVADYIYPTIATGAIYEGTYLLGTSMARPIIAKAQVEVARKVGADAVCHGCTGKGNDQVRFEGCFAALAPDLKVIAPWREWEMRSREDLLAYLAERDIKTSASATKIYSRDANAWHISHEGGELEDPWNEPSKGVWTLTVAPEDAPNEPEYVSLAVKHGRVTHVNDEALSPYAALMKLNDIAGKHGVGRIDITENRLVGMKSRGCYETPGGTVMFAGLRAIEELVLDKTSRTWREQIAGQMSHLVYDGRWFTPLCKSLIAASESLAESVNGDVVIKLYKGQATAVKKRSPNSLYSESFATFGEDDVYDQKHAEGFIRLYSLASRIRALNTK